MPTRPKTSRRPSGWQRWTATDTKQIDAPDIDRLDIRACSVISVTAPDVLYLPHAFTLGSVAELAASVDFLEDISVYFPTLLPLG
jgi:hypothetical protein